MQGPESVGLPGSANGTLGTSSASDTEGAGSLDPAPGESQAPSPPPPAAAAATGGDARPAGASADDAQQSLEAARKVEKARRAAKAGEGPGKGQQAQGSRPSRRAKTQHSNR